MFLQYPHFYFLDVFVEVDIEKGLMQQSHGGCLRLGKMQLKNLDAIIDTISKDENDYLRLKTLFKFSNTMADSFTYFRQLENNNSPSIAENNFQLLISYPKHYIKN